jgi:hypothetical protein
MNDFYTRVTAPVGFDGHTTRRDYYFKTRNAARAFPRLHRACPRLLKRLNSHLLLINTLEGRPSQ